MGRLLQSSSCHIPLKLKFKYSPLLPRPSRIDSWRLGFWESRRVNSLSCKGPQNPYVDPAAPPVPRSESSFPSTSQLDLANGSKPVPNFLERICAVVDLRKVTACRTLILVASIMGILLNLILSPPAVAGFHNATRTGGFAAASVGIKLIRTELLWSVWTGFFTGCLHTLFGPDHLAALAPLSIGRTCMESAAVGALWGCGHCAGQFIFCLIFLPPMDLQLIEVMRTCCIRVIGLTLLVIGAMGIKEAFEVHTQYGALETSVKDVSGLQPEITKRSRKKTGFPAFAIGVVHGLRPDWLMLVVVAVMIASPQNVSPFLVMFIVGTVVAMGSYTAFIGSCSQALEDRVPRIMEKLTWAFSLVAIGLGSAILVTKVYYSPWRTLDCLGQFIMPRST